MNQYIAFLRGINVSGHKKIKMGDLKMLFETLGYQYITTYIQSGNVIFQTESSSIAELKKNIENAIRSHYNFEVAVLLINKQSLSDILDANPFKEDISTGKVDQKRMYFTLLFEKPEYVRIAEILKHDYKPEKLVIRDSTVYFLISKGYGNTKLNNNFFENKLKVTATTRNFSTLNKLRELCLVTT